MVNLLVVQLVFRGPIPILSRTSSASVCDAIRCVLAAPAPGACSRASTSNRISAPRAGYPHRQVVGAATEQLAWKIRAAAAEIGCRAHDRRSRRREDRPGSFAGTIGGNAPADSSIHASNGGKIPRAADGIRTHDLLHGKQTL
jgi:hypothetical protein